jgi:phosphoribosyl 1,2-cyclic phosphodiesterase
VIAISLQSGSSGNCTYVETNGIKLLFDAGICGSTAASRLAAYQRDIREVDALLISHDHSDHINYAGVYQRKYGLPIYTTQKTLSRAERQKKLGEMRDVNFFMAGEKLEFGKVSVQTIPTPHDCADGVAFVISSGGKQLGILTDLGHAFKELYSVMASLDAVFIESNYDPAMLANGPYPGFLKKRIQGPKGHISNAESAELLQASDKLKWACLAHISEANNDPHVALRTHHEIVGRRFTFYTASRYVSTGILTV